MEDLEDRERAFKKQKENREKEQQGRWQEAERAKGEGKKMMEERLAELKAMEEENTRAAEASKEHEEALPPAIGKFSFASGCHCATVQLTPWTFRTTRYHYSSQIHP